MLLVDWPSCSPLCSAYLPLPDSCYPPVSSLAYLMANCLPIEIQLSAVDSRTLLLVGEAVVPEEGDYRGQVQEHERE